jgi:hypothetical protein
VGEGVCGTAVAENETPDRRGRPRARQLPGLLALHPLGAGGPDPRRRRHCRRPVRRR